MIVGYIRVSSVDQNTSRQLDGIKLDKVFEEKLSGKNITDRPDLQACLKSLNYSDKLYIQSMHLIATNNNGLLKFLLKTKGLGVDVFFIDGNLSFLKYGNLDLLVALRDFESKAVTERQKIGREKARRSGKQIGRPEITEGQKTEIKLRRSNGEPVRDVAKSMGIGVVTVCKYGKP